MLLVKGLAVFQYANAFRRQIDIENLSHEPKHELSPQPMRTQKKCCVPIGRIGQK